MPDIRYNTGFLDDFERPNETPIQSPWTFAGFSATTASLVSGRFQGGPGDTQYTHQGAGGGPFNTVDGPIEVWGSPGPGVDLTEALRIGFFDINKDGYMLIIINGLGPVVWNIRSYSGGSPTTLESVQYGFPGGSPNDRVLVQIEGGTLKTYYSSDNGANWDGPINNVAASGSGYYLMLGTSSDEGANPSWDGMGGGTEDDLVQIYRRPNE